MEMSRVHERPRPKDFDLVPSRVDRVRGHVIIPHGEREYKWYLDPQHIVHLVNGSEQDLEKELADAMKRMVRAILEPELQKRAS